MVTTCRRKRGRTMLAALARAGGLALLLVTLGYAALLAGQREPDARALLGARLAEGAAIDRLVVHKQERLMVAYAGEVPLKAYRVALSWSPMGHKQFQGDGRVPEGEYRITNRNPHSQYHKNLHVNYPNQADRAFAHKHGRSPGGDIKVHGLGPRFRWMGVEHWQRDWTDGCVAVTDEEIDELYQRVTQGALIEILP